MSEIKCVYCGSSYCDLETQEESFETIKKQYYCSGCKKRFHITCSKPAPTGAWLMTFFIRYDRGLAEYYQNSDSSLYCRAKIIKYDEIYERDFAKFEEYYDSPMLYTHKGVEVFLQNKKQSTNWSIVEVKMNPELTTRALKNQAMQAIYLGDNRFNLGSIRNDQLRADVCQWLRSTLPARDYQSPYDSSGGCYIATAVYGSYDCPQVWTLRRFRDNILAFSWYGRVLIRVYYAVSPALVRLFGQKRWFRNIWRVYLDGKVAKLQSMGIEATPYQDRIL